MLLKAIRPTKSVELLSQGAPPPGGRVTTGFSLARALSLAVGTQHLLGLGSESLAGFPHSEISMRAGFLALDSFRESIH